MSRTEKRLGLGVLSACLLIMLFTVPAFVVKLNAQDCHPDACHVWDPSSGLDDAFLYWWFDCGTPHCADCNPPM